MITLIMKHEWKILWTDRTLMWVLPLYIVLISYAVFNGLAWTDFQKHNITQVVKGADANFASLKSTVEAVGAGRTEVSIFEDPRIAGSVGRFRGYDFATLSPSDMAPLAIGQSDINPYYVRVNSKPLTDLSANDEIENPANQAAGSFDLSFVFIYLYPILILALSYNILSAEREQGTQAMLLSQPVSLWQFVWGKILLRGLVVFGVAGGLSVLAFAFAGNSLSSASAFVSLGLWILVVASYGAFWFALAILVNALAMRSSTNALVLMFAWLFFVVITPSLINVVAKSLYPVPSRIELIQTKRAAEEAVSKNNSKLATQAKEDSASMGAVDDAAANAEAYDKQFVDLMDMDAAVESGTATITQRFDRQLQAQQKFVQRLRFMSPAILTQLAMYDLAGSGAERYQRFQEQVKRFHVRWRGYFNPKAKTAGRLSLSDFDDIPRFVFVEEPISGVAGRVSGHLALLLVLSGLVGALGFARLRRYPMKSN